jgi:hypothetical protein
LQIVSSYVIILGLLLNINPQEAPSTKRKLNNTPPVMHQIPKLKAKNLSLVTPDSLARSRNRKDEREVGLSLC